MDFWNLINPKTKWGPIEFDIFTLRAQPPKEPGVYVICRLTSIEKQQNGWEGGWEALYVGVSAGCPDWLEPSHPTMQKCLARGATHIHLFRCPDEGFRQVVQDELLRAFEPPVNGLRFGRGVPKYDPAARLRAGAADPGVAATHDHDLNIFRQVRLVLEGGNAKDQFPTASLYCDWLLHTEVDRHPFAFTMIERMDTVFTADPGGPKEPDANVLAGAFALAALRQELIAIFRNNGIDPVRFTSLKNWNEVLTSVLSDLAGRPLLFPLPPTKKAAKEAHARITARRIAASMDPAHMVTSVRIRDHRDGSQTKGFPPGFYYGVRLREGTTPGIEHMEMVGWLFNDEPRAAFEFD